jgi:ribosomal protein S21
MKMPLQWHEQCLRNMKSHAERATIDAERAAEYASKLKTEIEQRERQLAEARRRGIDSFDADRFTVKRSGGES